jgi:DNA-binding protein H-NS
MPTLAELLREQAELQAQIDKIVSTEKQAVLERIREDMRNFGITLLEIEGRKRPFKPRGPRKPKNEMGTSA